MQDDSTRIARFDSGTISTSTTRTFTFPDENGTLLTSASTIPVVVLLIILLELVIMVMPTKN